MEMGVLSRTRREADGKECACSDGCSDNWETFWWRMQAERMMGCVMGGFLGSGLASSTKLGSPAVGGVLGESQPPVTGKRDLGASACRQAWERAVEEQRAHGRVAAAGGRRGTRRVV